MQFSVITLFPDLIHTYCQASILGRGQTAGLMTVETRNPRDFTQNPHRKVDDTPYGGGAGMVMACQPVEDAYNDLLPLKKPARILLTTPAGRLFDHAFAQELAQTCQQIVILCGHYEGLDARLFDLIPDLEPVSVGNFVLTGGELAALSIIDATSRMIPGVVQDFDSVQKDSFYNGLLDHPHYTKPAVYKDLTVPEVLLSGNHEKIRQWRRQQALYQTWRYQPALLNNQDLSPQDHQWINAFK